jgi:hypothetical protein
VAKKPYEDRIAKLAKFAETAPDQREAAFAEAKAAASAPEREVRAAAADAVAATGTPADAIATLNQLAQDADVGVRYAAVAAAAGAPWRDRFPILFRAMTDDDLGIVALAADGLSYAGDRRAIPVLVDLSEERKLRFGAMEGLYTLKAKELFPIASKVYGSFFSSYFDKAMSALAQAREGDRDALKYLLMRLSKRFAEDRNFIVAHLASTGVAEARAAVELIARNPDDASCESALLSLVRLDLIWWELTQQAFERNVERDPYAAGELLLGLFEINWKNAAPLALPHVEKDNELGIAARKVRLGHALRSAYPQEVQLRCD